MPLPTHQSRNSFSGTFIKRASFSEPPPKLSSSRPPVTAMLAAAAVLTAIATAGTCVYAVRASAVAASEVRSDLDRLQRSVADLVAAQSRQREVLQQQLAHGRGAWALNAVAAAQHRRQMQQALSLRHDRDGVLAQERMGRAHGCYIRQVTGATAMLDDCDPLGAKMEPAIEAESQRLAEATADNLGGVHWTSGDVPYKYDAFPMREAHGGYSGLSDISFPADAVYPTVYKPTLGLGPGDFAQAMGTKANKAAALHEHAGEDTETRAAKEVAEKKTAVVAEEAQEDDKLQAKEDKVEAALRTQHKEEAIAATDKAVGDKVMADAEKSEDEEKRTRLLKAATDEYKKAAEATEVAKQTGKRAAAAAAAASARPGASAQACSAKCEEAQAPGCRRSLRHRSHGSEGVGASPFHLAFEWFCAWRG